MAATPDTLGHYKVHRVLGKGAMGIVYEGLDARLHRRVAIKTIQKTDFGDWSARELSLRFLREAQAAARLNHPNIVQVYDFGEDEKLAFIVMELIDGKDLKTHFEQSGRFELRNALRIMCQLLDALDFAHQAGVVHRDIKPANVILDGQGRPKLTDFGVARLTDEDRSGVDATQVGTVVGTPAYMSPEQVLGQKIDGRSDIFSAGVLLYEFLTGRKPFQGGAFTLAKMIIETEPPSPSSLEHSIAPELDQIIRRTMAKNPDHRYATAREAAASIRHYLTRGSVLEFDDGSTVLGPKAFTSGKQPPFPRPDEPSRPVARAQQGQAQSSDADLEFWRSIRDSDDHEDLELYVRRFPDGIYVDLAKRKIGKLRRIESGATEEDSGLRSGKFDEEYWRSIKDSDDPDDLELYVTKFPEGMFAELAKRRLAKLRRGISDAGVLGSAARTQPEAHAREAEESARREDEIARRETAEVATRELARRQAEIAQFAAEQKAKREAEARAQLEADEKAKHEAEEAVAREKEVKAKREAAALAARELSREQAEIARQEVEESARREAEAIAVREADEKVKREAQAKAQREADDKAKRQAEEAATREAKEKAKHEAAALAALQLARQHAEAAKFEAAEKLRRQTEAEVKAKREAEDAANRAAEAKDRHEAQERASRESAKGRRNIDVEASLDQQQPERVTRRPVLVGGLVAALAAGAAGVYFAMQKPPHLAVQQPATAPLQPTAPDKGEQPRSEAAVTPVPKADTEPSPNAPVSVKTEIVTLPRPSDQSTEPTAKADDRLKRTGDKTRREATEKTSREATADKAKRDVEQQQALDARRSQMERANRDAEQRQSAADIAKRDAEEALRDSEKRKVQEELRRAQTELRARTEELLNRQKVEADRQKADTERERPKPEAEKPRPRIVVPPAM